MNMHVRRSGPAWLISLLILAFNIHDVLADDEVQPWLDRMSKATQTLSYDGVFIYQREGQLDVMRLIRSVDGEGEHERLVALNGPAREVIRENNMVTCILPSRAATGIGIRRASNPFLTVVPQHYDALRNFYNFRLGGEDRIAGRPARQLTIDPKDRQRYGYRLWVDKDTALVLKSQLVDADEKSMEQIMFTNLSILDHVPPELLKPVTQGKQLVWHTAEQEPQIAGKSCWRVNWLPAGFSLTAHELRRPPPSDSSVEHMVFSDGLALISVFIARERERPMALGWSHRGAVNTYTRHIGEYFVTVVGEVPGPTARQIAESVTFVGDAG
jgi:sigma-E factor negative regulatory protein RseB